LLELLRSKGYRFKREVKRVSLWKQAGNPDRVIVPNTRQINRSAAKIILRQIGMSDQEIEDAIGKESIM